MIEYWDVYNRNGIKLGYTKRSDEEFQDGEYHLGASLWIVNSKGELLIQKRAPFKKTYPNFWSITGGKVLAGECSSAACVREAKEEIGLVLSECDITFLYRSTGFHILFDDYITIIDFSIDKAQLQSSEVSEMKWVNLDQIIYLYNHQKFMYNDISDFSIVRDYVNHHVPKISHQASIELHALE